MSLVGSLEDLGLGDILQIISLSRKSGLLILRTERGEGRIQFRDGGIRAALGKGGPSDLRELVAASDEVAADALEQAAKAVQGPVAGLEAELIERELLTAERIEALRREHIDRTVIAMFAWPSGEFSFEANDVELAPEAGLAVEPGVNPQFLALEGTRLRDECLHEGGETAAEEPMFSGEADAVDAMFSGEVSDAPEASASAGEARPAEAEAEASEPVAPEAPVPEGRPTHAVIAVDPDLRRLEWIRAALEAHHTRVHIFQRADLAVTRIRQYLARAELPLVLLAGDAPSDPLTGARDAKELAVRLKAQSARLPIVRLEREGEDEAPLGEADARATTPSDGTLADPRRIEQRDALAEALVDALSAWAPAARADSNAEPVAAEEPHAEGLDAAGREALAALRAAGEPGRACQALLARACQEFARVAVFAVDGSALIGIAQQGLPRAGGPDDADFAEVRLPSLDCAAAQAALEAEGGCHRGPLDDEGGHRLAVLLGNTIPEEAWIAALRAEPGAPPCALLYADNLPGGELIGETAALEAFLRAAGPLLAAQLR